jgi:hypothetical protein
VLPDAQTSGTTHPRLRCRRRPTRHRCRSQSPRTARACRPALRSPSASGWPGRRRCWQTPYSPGRVVTPFSVTTKLRRTIASRASMSLRSFLAFQPRTGAGSQTLDAVCRRVWFCRSGCINISVGALRKASAAAPAIAAPSHAACLEPPSADAQSGPRLAQRHSPLAAQPAHSSPPAGSPLDAAQPFANGSLTLLHQASARSSRIPGAS